MWIWIGIAAAIAWLLWFMVSVPGARHAGEFQPLSDEERQLEAALRRHVAAVASREHNMEHPGALQAAAKEIESVLAALGYLVSAQRYSTPLGEVRNIEVEIAGGALAREIVLAGAHYDSPSGSPGANDNGSGLATLLELARLMRDAKPARTLRFVWFVNEEPPYYKGEDMGSRRYARRARWRNMNDSTRA